MNGVSRRQRVYDSREYVIHNRRVEYFILQNTLFFIHFTSFCKLFYSTFISLQGVMYVTSLRSFTLCLQLTPVIQNLWFICIFIEIPLSLL